MIRRGIIPVIILLSIISARADYSRSYPSFYGSSPSYYGSSESPPIVSIELDARKNLNSSFRIAAREERLAAVKAFISEGAEIDSASDSGETALMYASRDCSEEVVRYLLKSNANVNIQDEHGRTALMYAVMDSCKPVVRLLIRSPHIRLAIKDHVKKTAEDYAVDASYDEVDGPATAILEIMKKAGRLKRSKLSALFSR